MREPFFCWVLLLFIYLFIYFFFLTGLFDKADLAEQAAKRKLLCFLYGSRSCLSWLSLRDDRDIAFGYITKVRRGCLGVQAKYN